MWVCSICGGDRQTDEPCPLCDRARCWTPVDDGHCNEPIPAPRPGSGWTVCPNGHPYPACQSVTTESVEAWLAAGCPD